MVKPSVLIYCTLFQAVLILTTPLQFILQQNQYTKLSTVLVLKIALGRDQNELIDLLPCLVFRGIVEPYMS